MTLARQLIAERRARLSAERLLILKQAELSLANQKLGLRAEALSVEIDTVRSQNERVISDLGAATHQVQIAEQRLFLALETLKNGFAVFDASSRLLIANSAYFSIFDGLQAMRPGVSYSDILSFLTQEGIVDTGHLGAAQWRQMMLQRWQAPQPKPKNIKLWNGQMLRLIDQRGPMGDMVSLAHDVTAALRYKTVMKTARKTAEANMRAKASFLANISHEIRTPLHGVVGMADLLSSTALSKEQKLFTDTIKTSSESLLVILKDVLDYSKMEADRLTLRRQKFNLEVAIHDVLSVLSHKAQAKGLPLFLDYDGACETDFIGDPGRIRQIMINLIGNALKFTSHGHIAIGVKKLFRAESHSCKLQICVIDTGVGIPPDQRKNVFQEFTQLQPKTPKRAENLGGEGTGLGLAICQKLVSLMGGDIWVEASACGGADVGFTIELQPCKPAQDEWHVVKPQLSHVLVMSKCPIKWRILRNQIVGLGGKVKRVQSVQAVLRAVTAKTSAILFAEQEQSKIEVLLQQAPPRIADKMAAKSIFLSKGSAGAQTDLAAPALSSELVFSRLSLLKALQKPKAAIQPAEPAVQLQAGNPAGIKDERSETFQLRVLLAEDNKTNRLIFAKMMQRFGVSLRVACDGQHAVDLYKAQPPDIIFMDISMPKLDGLQAAKVIRGLDEVRGVYTPIIALTAHAMPGGETRILAAGMDHYLSKPVRLQSVVDQLRHFHQQRLRARPL